MTKKSLIIVNTGDGKGKTTAALGMIMRNLGWDKKVAVIQFAKGGWETGELRFLKKLGVEIIPTWEDKRWFEELPQEKRDEFTDKSLETAQRLLSDETIDLLVLDEINIMLRYGMITADQILPLLKQRPAGMTVILTGRNALPEILEAADLVSEIQDIKHPARAGIKAQKGIEF